MPKNSHAWSFFRAGGVDQVVLRTGDDLKNLASLDQKLWVALACPTKGTEIEERTLDLVDTDHDGRIRPPEVLGAIEWCTKVFKSLDLLLEKGQDVPLASLNKESDEGKAVLASAKRILKDRGKKEATEISLDDVLDMEKVFVATRFNGDGIVPAESAGDDAVRSAIEDVMAAVGSVTDRSGKPGVDQKLCDTFFEQAAAVVAWNAEGAAEGLRPLGDATGAAAAAYADVSAKIDDYFTRCRLAAYDAKAVTALTVTEAELAALSQRSLAATTEDIARLPLARVEAGRALPLEAGVNPAWTDKLARFVKEGVSPLLGGARTTLTESDWSTIKAKLDPFVAWNARKPDTGTAKLEVSRLEALLAGDAKKEIAALIEKDASLEAEYAQIASVEKAVRFRRELSRLLHNFVNFADFYRGKGASFQAGKLFLDARTTELVVPVADAGKHAALAGLSSAYLVYCDCTRPSGEKRGIVAAFTAGDTDNLMVGRNGVFYDRKGLDWDATITSIIENPISIQQAFWSPYKRLVRLIEEQVAKRAAEKEKASSGEIEGAATAVTTADQAPPAAAPGAAAPGAAPPAEEKKVDVGTVAAIGVAAGALATFLTAVLTKFLDLGIWMPLGVLAVLLAISGPSMLIAWLKLRRRNLGPILDANGWAVNNRAKINVPFGTSLTSLASLPEGSGRALDDPYAEKPTPWKLYVFLAILVGAALAWVMGKVDPYLPDGAKASTVLHRAAAAPPAGAAPAASAAPAAPK